MKLSIIVPVYNLEKYISKTLDSLENIDFPFQYEIIVVNDGSIDMTSKILEQYSKQYDNINVITISNGGVSNARNQGLSMATGEYVTFVDGDDTVERPFFRQAIYELDHNDYDFVQCNYRTIKIDLSEQYSQFVECKVISKDKSDMLERFLSNQKTIHNTVWGKVFRHSTIRGLKFDTTLSVAEDQKYVFDIILRASSIALLECIGYNYYQRTDSAMNNRDTNKVFDKLYVLDYMKKHIRNESIQVKLKVSEFYMLLDLYRTCKKMHEPTNMCLERLKMIDIKSVYGLISKRALTEYILLMNFRLVYDLLIRI